MAATLTLVGCIRGYYVYKDVWDPSLGETVCCEREDRNPQDPYATWPLTSYKDLCFDILASGIGSFITLTTKNSQYNLWTEIHSLVKKFGYLA